MSYSLNSLKGDIYGSIIGVFKGDTRSLDDSSCKVWGLERRVLVYNLYPDLQASWLSI